ncbi:hypothetical protein K502DRAFT_353878 [Neoconidiobolus thromboides FSU 785]|nr:hypothetical protein K502DRAFT_353878 [Neoconidiobolus thromboides FSU 785]
MLGTLNFIAFFLDPTVHHALKVIYSRTIKNQEIEEVQSTNLSINVDFELNILESGIRENIDNEREDQCSIISSNLIKSL